MKSHREVKVPRLVVGRRGRLRRHGLQTGLGERIVWVSAAAWALALASGAAGQVEIPPGWEIRTIVEAVEGRYCGWPDINDRGDAVFHCGDLADSRTMEVYLYSHGELIQISDDELRDALPKINNNREIVWQRELDGDGDWDIVLRRDGEMHIISDEPYYEAAPDINAVGDIVWDADLDGGSNNRVVFYFDGNTTRQISFNNFANNLARINQSSQIIWTRYNFGGAPWYSDVMLYDDGETVQLTQGRKQVQSPAINDLGQVVWTSPQGGLEKWDDGVTVTLLPDGRIADINNRGMVSVTQSDPVDRYYTMWLMRDARWWQLTDGPGDAVNGAINNRGEIVWQYGENGDYGVALFTRTEGFPGDLNLDGDVDLRDFSVLQSCYGRDGPIGLECSAGDMDQDDDIDIDDYSRWVEALQGPE